MILITNFLVIKMQAKIIIYNNETGIILDIATGLSIKYIHYTVQGIICYIKISRKDRKDIRKEGAKLVLKVTFLSLAKYN